MSPLLRAIVSRSVDDSRQAEAISALFVVDTFCHSVSSYVTKTMYAHCVPKRWHFVSAHRCRRRYSAAVHTAPMLPFIIAATPVLSATPVVCRLSWRELDDGKPRQHHDDTCAVTAMRFVRWAFV